MSKTSTLKTEIKLPIDIAKEICPIALKHREETENLRRLAPPVVQSLKDSRLFRMGLPKHLGGWGGNPIETLKAYETLASSEGSAAWIVWNNHLACTFGRYLDEDTLNEVYKDPSHSYANSARPEGEAKVVSGGYMVSGRWTLVSGCELADWLVLRCLVIAEGLPTKLGPGAKLKLFYIPKDAIKIIDTWDVGGLKGTGSHDVEVKEIFVSENYSVDFESPVVLDNPYSRLPVACINSSGCASISLGLLKAAIDELVDLCLKRVTPGKNPDLRDRLTVQTVVAKSKSILDATRIQLHNSVTEIWETSVKGDAFTNEQLADVWAASCYAATTARELVNEIYAVTGTASLYSKFRIERAHRDIHAVLQHGMLQPHWVNQAGMAYLGLTPTAGMFNT